MRYLLLFSLIGLSAQLFGQMPRNGDYSDWDWEDQSQNNWQRELSAGEPDNDGVNDGWANIKSPFSPTSVRVGEIVDVYATQDYTKDKGWELVWAHFNSIYPYFILYNEHKGLARAFFYLDGDDSYNYILANLSFHDTNNPGILAGGNEGANATDKYLSGSQNGEDDQISIIIPNVGLQSWCSADFPIFFDNNIKNLKYDNKKWVFLFYGADNYLIRLSGTNTTPPGSGGQHSISGGSVSSNQFSAQHGKFHKQLKTTSDFLQQMKNSTKNIDGNSPNFLQSYKSTVDNLGSVAQVFSAAAGISSGVGAVLGFFKLVSGSFSQNTTKPQAVIQYLDLEGTMDIKRTLGGTTIKIPGTNGSSFPSVSWNPYNCPTGYFNLIKTPTIDVVKPFARRGCHDLISQTGLGQYSYGYDGDYKKYRLDQDLELGINQIDGMDLIDIHFAIVCEPNGKTANKSYSIKDPTIAAYTHGIGYQVVLKDVKVPNPVYQDLENGKFIVHKFDEDNGEVVYGTPYIPMNQFKGVTFEVPEDTDVKLRIVAKFSSIYYDKPIVFQADYNFDVNEVNPDFNIMYCNGEQTNFLYSDYYPKSYLSLADNIYNNMYSAKIVDLLPGFTGEHGFVAEVANNYPSNGNTRIEIIDYGCMHSQSIASLPQARLDNSKEKSEFIEDLYKSISLYPNPSSGFIHVESSLDEQLERIQVYDLHGKLIDSKIVKENRTEFDISNEPSGVYMINMINTDKVIVRRVVKR